MPSGINVFKSFNAHLKYRRASAYYALISIPFVRTTVQWLASAVARYELQPVFRLSVPRPARADAKYFTGKTVSARYRHQWPSTYLATRIVHQIDTHAQVVETIQSVSPFCSARGPGDFVPAGR